MQFKFCSSKIYCFSQFKLLLVQKTNRMITNQYTPIEIYMFLLFPNSNVYRKKMVGFELLPLIVFSKMKMACFSFMHA